VPKDLFTYLLCPFDGLIKACLMAGASLAQLDVRRVSNSYVTLMVCSSQPLHIGFGVNKYAILTKSFL